MCKFIDLSPELRIRDRNHFREVDPVLRVEMLFFQHIRRPGPVRQEFSPNNIRQADSGFEQQHDVINTVATRISD